jgi:hypothetical protein
VLRLRAIFGDFFKGKKCVLWGMKCSKFLASKLEGYREDIVVDYLTLACSNCLDVIENSHKILVVTDGVLAEIRTGYLPHRIPSLQFDVT